MVLGVIQLLLTTCVTISSCLWKVAMKWVPNEQQLEYSTTAHAWSSAVQDHILLTQLLKCFLAVSINIIAHRMLLDWFNHFQKIGEHKFLLKSTWQFTGIMIQWGNLGKALTVFFFFGLLLLFCAASLHYCNAFLNNEQNKKAIKKKNHIMLLFLTRCWPTCALPLILELGFW